MPRHTWHEDWSMQFVCNFYGLNDVKNNDSYPVPRIRDVINRMHLAQFWTILDVVSAYWSITLVEEDKEKPFMGKFEFNNTPFSLCNAGIICVCAWA